MADQFGGVPVSSRKPPTRPQIGQQPAQTNTEKPAIRPRLYLQGQGDQLSGAAQAYSKPTLDEFLQKARTVNPGKADVDLKAYYADKYGN